MLYEVITPVDGQGVLDQVIGSYGQEVQVAGEAICRQGRGRHLDHATHRYIWCEADAFRNNFV